MHKLHLALLLATSFCFSQTLSIESGNSVSINSNSSVSVDGLELSPSVAYTLEGPNSSDIRNTYIKEYDTQGNVIKEVKSEGSSENIIYSYIFNYEYDVNLNWTKKTRFSNGKASKIIERQIVYYD